MHQILGFDSVAVIGGLYGEEEFGEYFAERLVAGKTLWEAWKEACYFRQPSGIEVAMLFVWTSSENAYNDHLWGFGSVSDDVDNPDISSEIYWAHWKKP